METTTQPTKCLKCLKCIEDPTDIAKKYSSCGHTICKQCEKSVPMNSCHACYGSLLTQIAAIRTNHNIYTSPMPVCKAHSDTISKVCVNCKWMGCNACYTESVHSIHSDDCIPFIEFMQIVVVNKNQLNDTLDKLKQKVDFEDHFVKFFENHFAKNFETIHRSYFANDAHALEIISKKAAIIELIMTNRKKKLFGSQILDMLRGKPYKIHQEFLFALYLNQPIELIASDLEKDVIGVLMGLLVDAYPVIIDYDVSFWYIIAWSCRLCTRQFYSSMLTSDYLKSIVIDKMQEGIRIVGFTTNCAFILASFHFSLGLVLNYAGKLIEAMNAFNTCNIVCMNPKSRISNINVLLGYSRKEIAKIKDKLKGNLSHSHLSDISFEL